MIFIWFEIMLSKKRSAKGASEYLLFTVRAIWICSVLLALLSYIFHFFFVKILEYVCICSFHSLDLFVLQLWVFITITSPFIKIQLFTLDIFPIALPTQPIGAVIFQNCKYKFKTCVHIKINHPCYELLEPCVENVNKRCFCLFVLPSTRVISLINPVRGR